MEPIDILNKRLEDHYGLDTDTSQPMFRIVWSDDQVEMRMTKFTESGIELLYPTVIEMKKYYYLPHTFVLERLVIVPDCDQRELCDLKLSYEPLWAFRDRNDNPVRPIWEATKFVIDTLYAALGKKSLRKYVEDTSPEAHDARIRGIQEELFGNETETTDALAYHEGVVVPSNYRKVN